MVSRRSVVVLATCVLLSPGFIVSPAGADLLGKQVSTMLSMLTDVFKAIDPDAAAMLAAKRDQIPEQISKTTQRIQPELVKEVEEIKQNMDERQQRTGEEGIPLWPQVDELLAMIEPMMNAAFNFPYQTAVAKAFSPYLAKIEAAIGAVTPPTDGSEFTPDADALRAAARYFETEASQIRKAASALKNFSVAGASSAAQLEQNLVATQRQISAAKGIHPMGDGAVDGLVAGLGQLVKVAQLMKERYDYFSAELSDGIVKLANSYLSSGFAGGLNDIADFVASLGQSLDSIASNLDGGGSSEDAISALNSTLSAVAQKKAAAESSAGGSAAEVNNQMNQIVQYFVNFLRDKIRHCYHEDKAAALISGIYSMADEYKNLADPRYMLEQLNSQLWDVLKEEILSVNDELNKSVEAKAKAMGTKAAKLLGMPNLGSDPLPGVPQFRFSGICGEYVPDPGSSAATVTGRLFEINSAIARVNREIKRRVKATGTAVCAPTNKKCIRKAKEAARLQKALLKVRAGVTKRTRKFKKELPKLLNEAYAELYGDYPYYPYK